MDGGLPVEIQRSGERFADVGGLSLCFESFGDPTDETVLLVMGLGLSMLYWREEFCIELAGRGFHVVRFDNRDVGRSSAVSGPGISGWQFLRRRARPVYTLGDMADDAAGLLDAIAVGSAHVVGVSLGSFIAQEVAIRHPERTRSLVSIMGRPGDGRTGRVARRLIPLFLRPAPRTPDGAVEDLVRAFRRIGSAGRTEADDADVRELTRQSMQRETANGSGRQLAAAVGERDRTGDLQGLEVPALVMHGEKDRVILPSGGVATAAAIPGAELLLVPGMGHDLARWVWPELLAGIERTARRASHRL
ncbi:alpha/beta hydrolase [Sporichthya sp.]|uniref:alpha/beta fold hydrolase n=1 Tax=Sporichthya sp. TaxID=65475 RepID=UPI0025E2AD9A|nr:alpha/beta hydrolase [Sporichthya sp.]